MEQFDPTLGTLHSVNITLTVDLTGSVSAENLGNTAAFAGVTDAATRTLNLPAGALTDVAPTADSIWPGTHVGHLCSASGSC